MLCLGIFVWGGERQGTVRRREERQRRGWQRHLPLMPGPAPKSSANLNGWIARQTFDYLNGWTRARGSERHAEWDIRKPEWRAGAGVAVALAAAASMNGRHARTRPDAFELGNREPVGAFVVVERTSGFRNAARTDCLLSAASLRCLSSALELPKAFTLHTALIASGGRAALKCRCVG